MAAEREHALKSGWQYCSAEAARIQHPDELVDVSWREAYAPSTVAMLTPAEEHAALDRRDHIYRCRFRRPARAFERPGRILLCFDGLASIAEIWLNGARLGDSDNMFVAQAYDVATRLEEDNELVVVFRSLGVRLDAEVPSGRFPTRLGRRDALRFQRTSLLGYLPDWCPEVKVVGPWRPVRLLEQSGLSVSSAVVYPRYDGRRGLFDVRLACELLHGGETGAAWLSVGDFETEIASRRSAEGLTLFDGTLELPEIEPWWPHSHGRQPLHDASVRLELDGESVTVDLGTVGFRHLELESEDVDRFLVRINGERVFCRGACWTPLCLRRLHVTENRYRRALRQVRDAGMNMLRVSGTMLYEAEAFYRLCDELGILIWQDFMFADFDYPAEDEAFVRSVKLEAQQWLARTAQRCSVAVTCGGTETQQQAAMRGASKDALRSHLFDELLPGLCARYRPDVIYVPSSPCRGDLPFHTDRGPSHYYGVGAYLRPVEDARLNGVRFATQCLAFSNVPDDAALRELLPDALQAHHPAYKAGVPRDRDAGWDFADVTDYYVEQLFGINAARLRYTDSARYFALCRVATGELMSHVQGQWRLRGSGCHGALVWFLRDLKPGAGWGVVDVNGCPKPAFYYLKRSWSPICCWFVERGLNGLLVCVDNEGGSALAGELIVERLRSDGGLIERVSHRIELQPRTQWAANAEGLLGRFSDISHAYRFGDPEHQIVHARFTAADAGVNAEGCSDAFHFAQGHRQPVVQDVGVSAQASKRSDGAYELVIESRHFAQAVALDLPGFVASDNYFHVAPGFDRQVTALPLSGATRLHGWLRPLNARTATAVAVDASE